MPTATLLQENIEGYAGPAHLYQLSAPLVDRGMNLPHSFVVVYTVTAFGALETIIVPARPDGSAIVMNRLPGSLVGIADHAGALWAAGGFEHGEAYSIVVPDEVFEPQLTEQQAEAIAAARAKYADQFAPDGA